MSHMKIPVANVGVAHKLRLPSEQRLGFRLFRVSVLAMHWAP